MASLNMNGPYQLTSGNVDKYVNNTSPGNYALGYVREDDTFIVQYVGRSDSDVGLRLNSWIGNKYKYFKFSFATSPKNAFEKECTNYHDFGESDKLHNESHPDRPDGSNWKCPRCGIFG